MFIKTLNFIGKIYRCEFLKVYHKCFSNLSTVQQFHCFYKLVCVSALSLTFEYIRTIPFLYKLFCLKNYCPKYKTF